MPHIYFFKHNLCIRNGRHGKSLADGGGGGGGGM